MGYKLITFDPATKRQKIIDSSLVGSGGGGGTSNVDDFNLVALAGYPNAYQEDIYDSTGAITERVWKTTSAGTVLLRHAFNYVSATVTVRTETSYRGSTPVSRVVTITESATGVIRSVA
jgi:hypothetical protein